MSFNTIENLCDFIHQNIMVSLNLAKKCGSKYEIKSNPSQVILHTHSHTHSHLVSERNPLLLEDILEEIHATMG